MVRTCSRTNLVMLQFLDIFFYVIHIAIILFCLFGWIHCQSRRAHLAFIGIIFACWFGLAPWYGWGYCPLTDWHWNIKQQLGVEGLPWSFIKHLWDSVFPHPISAHIADSLTIAGFILAIFLSVYLNFFNRQSGKQNTKSLLSNPQPINPNADL